MIYIKNKYNKFKESLLKKKKFELEILKDITKYKEIINNSNNIPDQKKKKFIMILNLKKITIKSIDTYLGLIFIILIFFFLPIIIVSLTQNNYFLGIIISIILYIIYELTDNFFVHVIDILVISKTIPEKMSMSTINAVNETENIKLIWKGIVTFGTSILAIIGYASNNEAYRRDEEYNKKIRENDDEKDNKLKNNERDRQDKLKQARENRDFQDEANKLKYGEMNNNLKKSIKDFKFNHIINGNLPENKLSNEKISQDSSSNITEGFIINQYLQKKEENSINFYKQINSINNVYDIKADKIKEEAIEKKNNIVPPMGYFIRTIKK